MRSWLRSATGWVGWLRPSTVVVPNVFHKHDAQVLLVEEQHAVGEFGSEGSDEPFGEAVRRRTPRRNLDHLDAHIGEDGIEGCGELASPVADQEPELGEAIAQIHREVADLLDGPSAVWVRGRAQQVHG